MKGKGRELEKGLVRESVRESEKVMARYKQKDKARPHNICHHPDHNNLDEDNKKHFQ